MLAAAGTRFNVGRAARGARAYLAVAGGFAVEPVLGSRSTYLPGRFGGFQGRALKHGDVLPLRDTRGREALRHPEERPATEPCKWSAPPLTLPDREPILVHVIEGQHFASFDSQLAARVLRHGVERRARLQPHGLSPERAAARAAAGR